MIAAIVSLILLENPLVILYDEGVRGEKVARVRTLLRTSNYCPRDIADIVRCSYQLATAERRKMRLPHEHDTMRFRLSRAEQEIRDLRRMITHLLREGAETPEGVAG